MAIVRQARDQLAIQPSVVVCAVGADVEDTEDIIRPWDQVSELCEVVWRPWPEPRAANEVPGDEHLEWV